MTRKIHQDFRPKCDQGKPIQTETVLTAFWKAEGFGRLGIRCRERSPSFGSKGLMTCRTGEILALPLSSFTV